MLHGDFNVHWVNCVRQSPAARQIQVGVSLAFRREKQYGLAWSFSGVKEVS